MASVESRGTCTSTTLAKIDATDVQESMRLVHDREPGGASDDARLLRLQIDWLTSEGGGRARAAFSGGPRGRASLGDDSPVALSEHASLLTRNEGGRRSGGHSGVLGVRGGIRRATDNTIITITLVRTKTEQQLAITII